MFNFRRQLKMKFKGIKFWQKNSFSQPAFSIVEIMTVLFIIALGLVGILSLIVQNIQSQSYNQKAIIANQLAQEGIELIRKTRDTNWRIGGVSYDYGLAYDGSEVTNNGCFCMDYTELYPYKDPSETCGKLYLDSNGFYARAVTASSSEFSRYIYITNYRSNISGNMMQVRSQVRWTEHNHSNIYELITTLYDWR